MFTGAAIPRFIYSLRGFEQPPFHAARVRNVSKLGSQIVFCTVAQPRVGPGFTGISMDVDAAVERVLNDPAEPLTTSARWTNLNTFSARSGKLIFYHGVSDPWFSALDTIDYYERMTKANGGDDKVRPWSRLFLVCPVWDIARVARRRWIPSMLSAPLCAGWSMALRRKASLPAGRSFPGRSRPLLRVSAPCPLQK